MLWAYRIELFAGLRVVQNDRIITRFRTEKTGILLAFLALHPDSSHSRDTLATLLWPDTDSTSARHRLRMALCSLRRQLEPPGVGPGSVLESDRLRIGLNRQAITCDVVEFVAALERASADIDTPAALDHLLKAVRVYRGPFLPHWSDDWIERERERLNDLFVGAARRLTRYYLTSQENDRALWSARLAVKADPLREDLQRDLMRVLAAAGQPWAALRQYAELQQMLAKELDVAPSALTIALGRRIQQAAGITSISPTSHQTSELFSDYAEAEGQSHHSAASRFTEPVPQVPFRHTRFYGREKEVADVVDTLTSAGDSCSGRVLTITGPGGTGKTRFAIEVAHYFADALQHAVWFVCLEDLSDPSLIHERIRDAIRMPCDDPRDALEQVVETLRNRRALLVLDGFEHLVAAGAPSVLQLVNRVPGLACLVTSRRRLDVPGERELSLRPLAVPDSRESHTVEAIAHYPSVRMFVDRAQAALPDFQVTAHNCKAIAQLCTRLEGVPLSIELAAARVRTLGPAQILDRLSEQFTLLETKSSGGNRRHDSLWATLDWSYRLLSEDLQRFFRRLSVFRGGWNVDAAAAVCPEGCTPANPASRVDDNHTVENLARLRSHSLIVVEESRGEMRYRLLETIRAYAWDLLSPAERPDLQGRHAQYFLHFAERAAPEMVGEDPRQWLDRLDSEHDNLRAALDWCEFDIASYESGLRLAGEIWRFWFMRGYMREGEERIVRLLSRRKKTRASRAAAIAWLAAGNMALSQGKQQPALERYRKSLRAARLAGDTWATARALGALGLAVMETGDFRTAATYFNKCMPLYEKTGDARNLNATRGNIGRIARERRDYELARKLFAQCLKFDIRCNRTLDIAADLHDLAIVCLELRELPQAKRLLLKSLRARQEARSFGDIDESLDQLGCVAFGQGHPLRAIRLFAAAERHRASINAGAPPLLSVKQQDALAAARIAVGEKDFGIAYREGSGMKVEDAITYALEEAPPEPTSG